MIRTFTMISALLLAGSVQASTIANFSGTFPVTNQPVTLDQFSGGALSSIEFLFISSGTGTLTVIDGPGNPDQVVDVSFGANISILDPSLITLVSTTPLATLTGVTIQGNGTPKTLTLAANNVVTDVSITNPALFPEFLGSGSIHLSLNADGQASTAPGLAVPFSITGSGETHGTVQVIYHPALTTNVSEGFSVALVGCGLVLLSFIQRRRLLS